MILTSKNVFVIARRLMTTRQCDLPVTQTLRTTSSTFSSQDAMRFISLLDRKEKPEKSEFVIPDYVKWVTLIDTCETEREHMKEEARAACLSFTLVN